MSSHDAPLPHIFEHQIAIRLHPADSHGDGLDVTVFASKLNALVSALVAADKAANGKKHYAYKVAKLASSSPTALISEVMIRGKQPLFPVASPIHEVRQHAADALEGRPIGDLRFDPVYRALARLSAGARKTYEYGELWTANDKVQRIDGFLEERAKRAETGAPMMALSVGDRRHFEGVAIGNFEGILAYVDLRGSLPAIKLALLIGGKQLDCVCKRPDTEKIRAALDKRAIVVGRAIYDGSGPLPRRIEVIDIRLREPADDFTLWKGTVRAFEPVAFADENAD